MCSRTGVGVGGRGVEEIEKERQGIAGNALLPKGALFVRGNKTVIIPSLCLTTPFSLVGA